MKQLRDTFIFKHLNGDDRLNKAVMDVVRNGSIVGPRNMEETFILINKNFKFALKQKVLDAVNSNEIVMVISPKGSAPVPTAMSWFLTKNSKGKVIAVVTIDNVCSSFDKDTKHCTITNPKQLYCMLESAYVGLMIQHLPNVVTQKSSIITEGSAIWADTFVRVLNKEYALNVDRNKVNTITYLASKFYLINILGMKDSDRVNEYAYKNCVNPNRMIIDDISNDFTGEVFDDVSKFIQALAFHPETSAYLPKLQVRTFLQQYILMYTPAMLLSLESLPYFLYNVASANMGAYINNQQVLEPIVEKRGAKIYLDLARA